MIPNNDMNQNSDQNSTSPSTPGQDLPVGASDPSSTTSDPTLTTQDPHINPAIQTPQQPPQNTAQIPTDQQNLQSLQNVNNSPTTINPATLTSTPTPDPTSQSSNPTQTPPSAQLFGQADGQTVGQTVGQVTGQVPGQTDQTPTTLGSGVVSPSAVPNSFVERSAPQVKIPLSDQQNPTTTYSVDPSIPVPTTTTTITDPTTATINAPTPSTPPGTTPSTPPDTTSSTPPGTTPSTPPTPTDKRSASVMDPISDDILTDKLYPEDLDVKWNSWKCLKCEYVYEGQKPLTKCPRCGNDDPDNFDDPY